MLSPSWLRPELLDLPGLQIHIQGLAHGADHLAHETAGLAEVVLFRPVGRPRDDDIVDFVVVVKLAQNAGNQDGKGGRRAEPGADGQGRGDFGVEAADREPQILECRGNPSGQGDRLAEFRRADRELTGLEQDRVVALAVDTDDGVRIRSKVALNIQVDRGSQNTSVLMIRVVAGKFRPAGYR